MQKNGLHTGTDRQAFRRQLKYSLVFLAIILALVLLAVFLTRCAVKSVVQAPVTEAEREAISAPAPAFSSSRLEIPAMADEEFLIVCEEGRYALLYDTFYRQAAWAAYVLTASEPEERAAERKNGFIVCSVVRSKGWPYARESDYTNTGYDRGHLVPSADRLRSQEENNATFRMSNIAPQTPRLNRVLWYNLEQEVRRMTERFDTLWIVTGGELKPGLPRIGAGGVGVPERFFKVLLGKTGNDYRSIAFVIPNAEEIPGTFRNYAVSVDEAEKLSGIDFFPNLPDALEYRIEAQYLPVEWYNP